MTLKKELAVFIYCILFLYASNVSAEYGIWSGNSWMIVCEHNGTEKNVSERCEFYTRGAIEGLRYGYAKGQYDMYRSELPGALPFCISETHSIERFVKIIKNYIKKHTALLRMPAPQLISNAMSESFPCAIQ